MAAGPNILCAVDGSGRARVVAELSRRLARELAARVVVARVFDPMAIPTPPSRDLHAPVDWDEVEEDRRQGARHGLLSMANVLVDVEHAVAFVEGQPRAELLRLVDAEDARLLVIGSAARRPLDRLMKGSLAGELAAGARCPTVVVADDDELHGEGPIVAGYDGSEHSLRAARHGAALAAATGRELLLVQVAARGEPVDAHGLDVTVAVERGEPVERLVRVANDRDASFGGRGQPRAERS